MRAVGEALDILLDRHSDPTPHVRRVLMSWLWRDPIWAVGEALDILLDCHSDARASCFDGMALA